MKIIYGLLYSVVLLLLLLGSAIAGEPTPKTVPTFTPWGALVTAAVLGVSGAYILLKKRK